MGCCLKLFAVIDMLLGTLSLVIEIVSLATNNGTILPSPLANYGAGIWCGVIFIVTGAIALKYESGSQSGTVWRALLFVMCVLATCCGVAQITLAGIHISDLNLGDCIPNVCSCEVFFGADFCSSQTAYSAVLISSGVLALIINPIMLLVSLCGCCAGS